MDLFTLKKITSKSILVALFLLFKLVSYGQTITGTIFKDFNANGVKDNSSSFNEVGMPGVKVIATNPTGSTLATTYTGGGTSTNGTGGYSVTGGTLGQVRLEFIMPDDYTFASNGAAGGTSIQFPTTATQNLAVNYPTDYCQTNPGLVTACLVGGALNGPGGAFPAVVRFGYTGYDKYIGQSGYTAPTQITNFANVGTLWGTAYARSAKKVYSAAYLRRQATLGPLGIGGIYQIDPATNTVNNWLDAETLAGIDAGTDPRDGSTNNSIPTSWRDPSYDLKAYPLMGKTSFGDLEISTDESTLYVVNLFQQSLVAIDANTKALVGSYPISASALGLTVPQSDFRPWGLKYYRGKLYVGAVYTAETSKNAADLKAYVLEFDPKNPGAGFSIFFSVALNYVREQPEYTWQPWNITSVRPGDGSESAYNPQPILTNIEFDTDGSLILGIMDRLGLMFSTGNYGTDPTSSDRSNPETAGDILRACMTSSGLVLEGGTGCSYNVPASGATATEFYDDQRQGGNGNGNEKEIAQGALALLPGSTEVVGTTADEYDGQENGVVWWNNTNGRRDRAYMIFDRTVDGSTGKTTGLGDLELLCDPAPIEIGNRVWSDTDSDGIQDAGETGIAGVSVTLLSGTGTLIATATTDANGNYYFSSGTGTSTSSAVYSLTALTANTNYQLKFPTTNGGNPLVKANAGADNIDSDAPASGVVSFSTASIGANDHTFDVGYGVATCNITLTPTVSGCYSISGVSKATVSVEVAWSNAPSGNITVTLGGQTRTITPGVIQVDYGYNIGSHSQTIVSPQVVAFEINLPDAGGSITAAFDNSATCTATSSYTAPAACPPTTCNATANQTGGTVFNDYNADGVLNTGETAGLAGVTVKAIDCNGTVYTTTTDAYGKYVLDIPAANYPVRVEFSNLPKYAGNGTLRGTDGQTTTQFVTAPTCGVDLGVLDPNDYCQSNPKIIVPCYVYGDPLNGSTSGTRDAVVGFDYSTSGLNDPSVMTSVSEAALVGTTWGTAYNKFTKKLFMSATIKRHAGLGPLGLGGIYISDLSDPDSPVTSSWLDVTTLGINVGSIPSNALRGLAGDPSKPSTDSAGYAAAGKLGIGGLDLSSDGNKLYFTNLFDNKLYEIDITAFNSSGTLPSSANVKSYDMTNGLTCPSGSLHAWAVKVHKEKVYVGIVCDAGISQNKSDLRAYVQELDGTTVNTAFDFPLTYPKGFLDGAAPSRTGWFPWTDDWAVKIGFDRILIYPQPIFSSIEFDIDGSMVLAFGDRTGVQTGYFNIAPDNKNPNPSFDELYSGIVGGDILRAYSNGTSYVLENNAKAGPTTGFGVGNGQGPGFGEFYNDNFINGAGGGLTHAENSVGGLALLPGSGEVIAVSMDPLDIPDGTSNTSTYFQAGGVRHMNNSNGQVNSAYVVYSSASGAGIFGKATGLGDAVLNCSTPTYLEIGNRVWVDTNKDGIQDACEKVLSGVNVSLYKGTTLIATTQTDANGEYYFSSQSKLSSGTWSGTGADTTLLPNTAYQLLFGTGGQFASGVLSTTLGSFSITAANATGGLANDQNDSDIQLTTLAGITAPGISLTTGALGSVDHTFDAGFICVTTAVASMSVTPATCNIATNTANNDGQISLTGISNADKAFLITSGPIPSYTATGGQPISASAVAFTGLNNPATAVGQSYTIVIYNGPCCYTTVTALLPYKDCNCVTPTNASATATPANTTPGVTITLNATATGTTSGTTTYTWSGAGISVPTASTVASLTVVAPALAGVYTYTVLVANGASCTATATTSVTIAEPATIVVTSATVCYGSSTTLVASGCTGTVTWSNSTTGVSLVTPALTTTTNYTATCTTAGSSTYAVGTVTVLSQPVLSLQASSTLVTVGTPVSLSAVGCLGTVAWSTGDSGSSISVTPANSTNVYSATCTTGPTCTTTASITVTTAPSPSLVVVSATICWGSSATLVASGCAGSVSWSNSATGVNLVTPALTQTTSYTATCTVAGSSTYAVGTVTVLSQPVLSLQASSTLVTVGTPVSLSAIGCVGTVAWSTGDSGSSISVTPANSTNVYSATCTTGPTCTTTASITVTTQAPACQLTLQVTPGSCTSATNQYVLTGTLSLTNAGAGSLTITDGNVSTVLAISANQSTATFSLTGISSDGLVHIVVANLSGCGQTSTTYTAPQSCTYTCQPPVHVCKGSNYAIGLSTTSGLGTYQWYLNGVTITGATQSSYTATQAGSYSVVVNGNVVGQCPDGSCCPVVIVEDSIALYQANAQSPTCTSATAATANADGRILVSDWQLSGSDTTNYYYQVSLGSSFDAAHVVAGGANQLVPASGVLVANLPNPSTVSGQSYTVRISTGLGCSRDVVVNLLQTVCGCPPAKCVPFVIKRVK